MTEILTTTDEEKKEFDGELPVTIKLKYPVMVGKETMMTELVLSEIPDAQSMALFPVGEATTKLGDMYPVIAAMAKKPESHIRKVKWLDLKECIPIVTYFLAE